jgi:hypothetical protein
MPPSSRNLAEDGPDAQLKHEEAAFRVREKPSTQFSLKIKMYLVFDTSKGLVLGHMAVATRSGRPPNEAASPRSVVMVLSGGKKRRLSRSVWSVAPVVGRQAIRDI